MKFKIKEVERVGEQLKLGCFEASLSRLEYDVYEDGFYIATFDSGGAAHEYVSFLKNKSKSKKRCG